MKRLSKTLYVAVAGEGDEAWLSAASDIEHVVEDDGPTTIGVYELTKTVVAIKTLQVADKPK